MKSFLAIFLLMSFHFLWQSPTAFAEEETLTISLSEVYEIVKSKNFLVREKLKKLEQAGFRVSEARARLYPQLNFFKFLKIVFSPADWVSASTFIDVAQDVAPFLAPSRGFQVKQNEILYLAEKESTRATLANAIMTAKSLYLKILQDQEILEILNREIAEVEKLYEAARSKEEFGSVPRGLSSKIDIRLQGYLADQKRLEVLLALEIRQFSLALGLPARAKLNFISIEKPDLSSEEKLDSAIFLNRALNTSPEVAEYREFVRVIPFVKKEVRYSWLGLARSSRGPAAGIFDEIAVNEEISLGNKWTQKILAKQLEIFNLRLEAASEIIQREVPSVVDNFNLRLDLEKRSKRAALISDDRLESLKYRLRRADEKIEIIDTVDAVQDHLEAQFALIENIYGFVQDKDKLDRLIFQGDYSSLTQSETIE